MANDRAQDLWLKALRRHHREDLKLCPHCCETLPNHLDGCKWKDKEISDEE